MGKIKVLLSAIGLALLAIAIIFLIPNFINKEEFQIDPENLSVFDEDHSDYYLTKAPKNIGFEVFLAESTKELEYKLMDEAGNEVDARIKKKNDSAYEIRAPKSGYDEGERYRLELGEGILFYNKELLHADSLVFAIERGPIEHYKFTDQVVELDQEILEVSSDIVEVGDNDFKEDDIIFGLNEEEEYVAYKVAEVMDDGRAQVTIPAIDEIYSELEVYGDYEFDFNDIVSNPEIETKVVNNIKESEFYSFLMITAYADEQDDGDVDIYLEYEIDPKDNALQIKVVITLKAGENGLFAKKGLKDHEVKLTLVSAIGITANLDIDNVKNWDASASRSESFAWELDITYKPSKFEHSSKLSDLFQQDNEEDIMEITRLLNEMVSDEMKNDIKLFEHGIPISGIPGLILSFEVNIALSLELQANLNLKNDYSTVTTIGLMHRDSEFKPYFNNNYDTSGGEASIKGELKSKAGLNFEIKTKLIHDKVAYMSLKPEVGLYADAYVAITLNNLKLNKDKSYGYIESGTYFNALVKGHINTLFKKYDFQDEIDEVRNKFEKLSFGDYKIISGLEADNLTIYSKDSLASPPDFTFNYYDIRSGEEQNEPINHSEISYFLEDGKEVKLKGEELMIPETDQEELIVQAKYKYENGRVYSQDLQIYISENRQGSLIDHDNFEDPMHLTFSSGVGAWRTVIELSSDGSFTGMYLDANAGANGNGYLATNYISEFTGWFGDIQRLDEETYSMELLDINYKYEEDEEWIEDQVKYIASYAYGFEEGKDFFLYSPKKPVRAFDIDLLSWVRGHGETELQQWVLHNQKTDYGFHSKSYLDDSEDGPEEVEAEETIANSAKTIPTSFEHIQFDNNYSGPGSEFIGTWHEVNDSVQAGPINWEINYNDGIFYMSARLPGDPATLIMTAEYKNNKLHSTNGTQLEWLDYENPDTLEIEFPETIESGDEVSQFFFEDGYLQWVSETRGDFREILAPNKGFKGYERE